MDLRARGCEREIVRLRAEVTRLESQRSALRTAEPHSDTVLLNEVERYDITLRWESDDDPYAQRWVATRRDRDGDISRPELSPKFRGPVRQALRAAILSAKIDDHRDGPDVWAPDYLAASAPRVESNE